MKKLIILILLIAGIFGINAYGASPKVNVNGKILENTAIIKDGRTLVGVRGVFEELGYEILWDNSSSTATLKNSENTIVLINGPKYFTLNGKPVMPDVPQQIIDSRFYLPLRAIGEAIGAEVSWDKVSETAIISMSMPIINTESEAESVTEQKTKATPGLRTIKNFLKTAIEPVGTTMYIYGGGWNEEDTGAGVEAVSIGLSPKWAEFASKQTSSYSHNIYNYKKNVDVIHLGLDCSGYVGWAVYNTLNNKNGLEGYVDKSTKMAADFANRKWGTLAKKGTFSDYKAGDVMSSSCGDCAHVWICVGQCDDGSVVLLHSSPQGVMLSGTYTPQGGKNSQAVQLASKYMSEYYPDWYAKYPDSSRNTSYLSHYDRFRWSIGVELADPDGLTDMGVEEVLEEVFKK